MSATTEEIQIDKEYLIKTRRYLHQHPELSLHEFETAKFIRNELKKAGIPWRKVGETGTLGYIHGQPGGRRVLLRADIDALPIGEKTTLPYKSVNPGVMHACGHDIHTASLLGAARALAAHKDSFQGTVLLAFQPAEEFGHGSKFFAAEGLTKGYDRALGIHISTDFPVGTVALTSGPDAASCDFFRIRVHGRGAHIVNPQKGINALAAASEIALHLPDLRNTLSPTEPALVGVGKIQAGTTYNQVADEAVIEGTIRALSEETQLDLQQKVKDTARWIAGRYGAEAETEIETFTPPIVNDRDAFEEVRQTAEELFGKEHVISDRPLLMGFGSDDFAEFLRYEKGVYVHAGVAGDNPKSRVSLHNAELEPDEGVLITASSLLAGYALKYLAAESREKLIS